MKRQLMVVVVLWAGLHPAITGASGSSSPGEGEAGDTSRQHFLSIRQHTVCDSSIHVVTMRTLLAQLAAKVWEALKPPQPEYGYFMPDEQSEAIRKWCKVSPELLHIRPGSCADQQDVASSALLDPNIRDPSEPPRVRDKYKSKSSKPGGSRERSSAAERNKGEGGVCTC